MGSYVPGKDYHISPGKSPVSFPQNVTVSHTHRIF